MKCLFIHGLCLLFLTNAFSVSGQSTKEITSFGWTAYSQSLENAFGAFRNEAGLAHVKNFSAGLLAERHFMLDATSSYAFAAVFPVTSGAFSLQGVATGFNHFSQQRLALAYGRPLASWLSAGLQLDYMHMRVPMYGSAHAFTFGTALLMRFDDHWSLGVQAFNPVKVKYDGLGDDSIPAVYRLGIGYQPSKIFYLCVELSKTGGLPVAVTAAFHYRIVKQLGIKGGVSTGEERIFLGIAVFLDRFEMIFTAMHHPTLGLSPGAGCIYEKE